MITLAQAHERLNDLLNQMRRLAKGFDADDEHATALNGAIDEVAAVLDNWFTELNPPPAEEAAPASVEAPAEKPAASAPAPAKDGATTKVAADAPAEKK